jgi:hypothetical protein
LSVKIMTQVWEESRHGGSKLLLLLAIADNANDQGIAWPTEARLATKIRMSVRQVRRLVHEIAESGEIAIEQTRKGRSTYNIYRFPSYGQPVSLNPESGGQDGDSQADIATSPESSKEPSGPSSAKASDAPKPSKEQVEQVWEAVDREGMPAPIHPEARKEHARLVRVLAAHGATGADVSAVCRAYRGHKTLGEAMLTLPALVKWWQQLRTEGITQGDRIVERMRARGIA